ncbi:MAG TPA: type IV pilin protein [Burkholderiaceae bacterium]|jgi:type IV pilus assembly protein PilE|nr:type IV pilin protein [Burkholderiaceae bacterium]
MKNAKAEGFTLLEVMMVVVIVGILAAVAYPSYQESVRKARRAEARAALMQLMQQEERYYSQNTRYIAFSSDSTSADEKKFKWFSGDSVASSSYEISARACADESIQNCVELTAVPGTTRVNPAYRDPVCGNLTLSSTGRKTASGNGANCW